MQFGQLIEYKFFLKNHAQNVVGLFLKSQNWVYLWTNNLKFFATCFDGITSWGLSQYIETKLQTNCLYFI